MTKRYRTDIIKKFGIRFSSKIKFVEDRPFVLDYLRYCNSVIVTDTNGYIIKSSREAQYRLSQGVKPADYLCYNILESYLFLCRYAEEMQMDKIREYADNYLIDKVYTYLLIPSATKLHPKSAYNLVLKTFKQYLLGVNQNYIKNKHNLMFINIFINVNPSLAIFLLQCRIKVGKMVRKIVK